MEMFAFVVLTVLALVSASVVVFHRSPVISALALVFNLAAIAGYYMLLNAQFLALLQVIVYAGAIMVLILFVVMLLNLQDEDRTRGRGRIHYWLGMALAAGFAVALAGAFFRSARADGFDSPSERFGTVGPLGLDLFDRFFYPFEAISLLLIVAMIGAVLLAKKRL